MSKEHKVHLRGATVSESEKIKATSLEHQFKNIWVRNMCFIHINKEQNIATPLNELGQPIVPDDFEPSIKLVQKYRKWFTRDMKERSKFFQNQLRASEPIKFQRVKDGEIETELISPSKSLKHSLGQLSSYMDDYYSAGIAISKCKTVREYAEHLCAGMDEASIKMFEDHLNKLHAEKRKTFFKSK